MSSITFHEPVTPSASLDLHALTAAMGPQWQSAPPVVPFGGYRTGRRVDTSKPVRPGRLTLSGLLAPGTGRRVAGRVL